MRLAFGAPPDPNLGAPPDPNLGELFDPNLGELLDPNLGTPALEPMVDDERDDERDQLLGRFRWLHKAWRTAPPPLPGWQAPSSVILDGELLVYDEVPRIASDCR
jgi:hypothetical protein